MCINCWHLPWITVSAESKLVLDRNIWKDFKMWIDLFVHRTTTEHESRWISVINPATEYTVRSPFQHPFLKTCEVSCIREPILPNQRCEWHGSCCRLEYERLPCLTLGQDTRPPVCFHLYEGELEKLPPGFLDYLRSCDHLLISTLVALFLTGIELSLSTLFKQQLNRILTNPSSSQLSAADQAYVEERTSFFGNYANNSVEFLGQIARFFDLYNDSGAFLPRPGKESRPELNMTGPNLPFLKVVSFSGADSSPTPWPSSVVLWPSTEVIIRKYSDACSFVPWAKGMPIQLGNTLISVEHLIPLPNVMSILATNDRAPRNSPFPFGCTFTPVISRPGLRKEVSDISQVETWLSQAEPNSPPGSNGSGLVRTNGISRKCRSETSRTDSSLDAECEPDFEYLAQHQSVNTNENSDDSDKESTYPVETLLSHRPPVSYRSKVRSYRVRWAGKWPASQKETWEPTSNIALDIIDSYWADLKRRKRQRRQSKRNSRGV